MWYLCYQPDPLRSKAQNSNLLSVCNKSSSQARGSRVVLSNFSRIRTMAWVVAIQSSPPLSALFVGVLEERKESHSTKAFGRSCIIFLRTWPPGNTDPSLGHCAKACWNFCYHTVHPDSKLASGHWNPVVRTIAQLPPFRHCPQGNYTVTSLFSSCLFLMPFNFAISWKCMNMYLKQPA